ncbi:MAG: hypothetical protein EOO24_40825 [Comamonadaceae bacterium]|nr:MAG: hypothetical protein EOO24_40825 [Comamonadaceae bacterium]
MKSGFEVGLLAIRPPGRPRAVAEQNDESALAWRREMERAQIEAWLSHATLGLTGVAQPVPVPRDTAAPGRSAGHVHEAKSAAAPESAGLYSAPSRTGTTRPAGAYPEAEDARWMAIDRPDTGSG